MPHCIVKLVWLLQILSSGGDSEFPRSKVVVVSPRVALIIWNAPKRVLCGGATSTTRSPKTSPIESSARRRRLPGNLLSGAKRSASS